MAELDPSDAATIALVTYLRSEADQAEQKAKSLRAQADQLAAAYAITDEMQRRYELHPSEVPPLDEHGLPKYSGRKRGRKPRPRKRRANPNRKKRQHTAYTLFVQEHYPTVKQRNPDWASKDVISVVAKMWAEVPPEEKGGWKLRAMATHDDYDEDENDDDVEGDEGDDEKEGDKNDEGDDDIDEDNDGAESDRSDDDQAENSSDEEHEAKLDSKHPPHGTRRRLR